MKKYFYTFAAAALCIGSVTLSACGGDSPAPDNEPDSITSFTIEVDKSTIEADNKDAATFIVRNQDGIDVTNDPKFNVRIMNMEDNSALKEPKVTAYKNGPVTFSARYNGKKSQNEVIVTGVNRKTYETYFRHVAMMQLTGEWCGNCPTMTKILNGMTDLHDRMVRMAYHQGDKFEIPATKALASMFNISGYPSGVIDLRVSPASYAENYLRTAIKESQRDYPAVCGIKISTTLSEDKKSITVTPEVTVTEAGRYAIAWVVLVDDIDGSAQSGGGSSYRHNNTVLVSPNQPIGGFIKGGSSLAANEKWTPSGSELQGFESPLPNYPIENMRVAVYVLNETKKDAFSINNLNVCKVGESMDYIYND